MTIEFLLYPLIAGLVAYFSSEIGDFLVKAAGYKRNQGAMLVRQRIMPTGFAIVMTLFFEANNSIFSQTGLWVLLLVYFLLITVIDLRHRLVLNMMTYPGLLVAIIFNLYLFDGQWRSIIIGGIFAFGIFLAAAWLSNGVGGGDIKLASVIGLLFGFPLVTPALLVGGGAGAIYAAALLRQPEDKKQKAIPYAPFLCLGVLATSIYLVIGG